MGFEGDDPAQTNSRVSPREKDIYWAALVRGPGEYSEEVAGNEDRAGKAGPPETLKDAKGWRRRTRR